MRDKTHTQEVKVRLTEQDKARIETLSAKSDIPVAALARMFIKQFLATGKFDAAILQAGLNKGSPHEGLGATSSGNQSAG